MQTLSAAVANDIERILYERMHNVQSWSQLAIMQELKIGDVDKRLSDFLQELRLSYGNTYRTIYVADTEGKIIASSQPQNIGQVMPEIKPWFAAALNTEALDTQFTHQALSFFNIKHHVLAISQDITEQSTGRKIGRLVAEFNWQIVQDSLNHAIKKPTAAALLDADGNVLAATANWQVIKLKHDMHASTQFSKQSANPNWQVRVEKLRSVAIAPVHRLAYVFVALLITTLMLAALLVTPIAQAITKPLSQLTQFVLGYAQQKQTKPPQSGPPEVRELGAAFEAMTKDLATSQDQLTRAAKLAVVGEMAAAMSHEVRTPLGILRSSADVLKREKNMSAEGQEVLGFISSETERLNKLVSTLIDSARPRLPVFVEVNMTALVINVLALLRTQAQAKNIHIAFNQQAEVVLNADADHLTQVLMNLIMNAIQTLPIGGSILVLLSDEARQVRLEIADNGAGIATENQAQIFEPFFTQRAGGVGLGLAIVRQIVQAHGGEINYETSQMGGAQFTIVFPKKIDA